ncbi:hypothetical protein, unknown function [Leishmania infantum JPCM5]|uniref:Uncharacterized protein n=3 Tax=Leishmania donovani species complex TaxID=38574 RepID=A4I4Q5_LEIIN|nr:hypothetical protein, unknown function [Leishmania infantum JPCM5]XP_003862627.1 hypothetical protein, unknown function [Leishmania donovani]CAC9509647.1 hypothetical_protein_-_conserved [Leishmania infantum]CAM69768.1 hypothetical protein, unknown function [Leishmania infantum JPCM5]CBZ35934.1 hypothetical protein, unknown function [Leishmania donovani]SUZ43719.1 hypothetical_protein_-_conserved [Leishmania infantum]|eukprot:XP_001466724.1 hypothetical protein, unknown function [Leishmania infantum JPCM5]
MSLLSDRAVVEHQLQRQGGEVLANPTRIRPLLISNSVSETKLVNRVQLCESKTAYVSAKCASAGVAHSQWLVDCVEAVAVLLWTPRHMLYGSRSCKTKMPGTTLCMAMSQRGSLLIVARVHQREAQGRAPSDAESNPVVVLARRVHACRHELGLDGVSGRPAVSKMFAAIALAKGSAQALLSGSHERRLMCPPRPPHVPHLCKKQRRRFSAPVHAPPCCGQRKRCCR